MKSMQRIFAYWFGVVALLTFDLSALSFDAKLGFDSKYVTRGHKMGSDNVLFSVGLKADISGGHFTAGITSVELIKDLRVNANLIKQLEKCAAFPLLSELIVPHDNDPALKDLLDDWSDDIPDDISVGSFSNVSPHMGYIFKIGTTIKADIGYVAYIHTNLCKYNLVAELFNMSARVHQCVFSTPDTKVSLNTIGHNTHEIYGGLRWGASCNPSAYLFYDIANNALTFIGNSECSWTPTSHISLTAKASAAYNCRRLPVRERKFYCPSSLNFKYGNAHEDYFYYGAESIITYRHNDNIALKGHFSYRGNTAHKNWTNVIFGGSRKGCLWFGGTVEVDF
ncbi:MAG: hypothetical protein LBD72_00295 [Puniceicoccales bacterium]|jgi:hypothetical protein|nr:hypothetical protein [Puniceicoccales bacterium]